MSRRKAKVPEAAAQSPLVAMAEMARSAEATHAVIAYRTPDGMRHYSLLEGMDRLSAAGLLLAVAGDLTVDDLALEDEE